MGADDWEAVFAGRLAALPEDEEKYGWYAKVADIEAMAASAAGDEGKKATDPDLYENVKRALTGGEGSPAVARDYAARSARIRAAIKNAAAASGRKPVQKAEMQSLELDDLMRAAEGALPFYGELLQNVADELRATHPVEFLVALFVAVLAVLARSASLF